MRLLSLLLLVLSHTISGQTWIPVWNDEFDYQGLPDESKWSYETGCSIRNEEAQYYSERRSENTNVKGGNLIITARRENLGGCSYTSGSIHTRNKGDWKYGKIEVRAKLPKGRGMWPAIWMMSTDESYGTWPRSGEIDIMEHVGYEINKIFMTVHTEAFNHIKGTEKGTNHILTDVYDTYHIYSIEWSGEKIDFLIDGTRYFTFSKTEGGSDSWPFDKPFYLKLNVAVGGSWGGVEGIDNTIFPQQMTIDYVRVLKLQNGPGPFTINTESSNGGNVKVSPATDTYAGGSTVTLEAVPQNGFVFEGWQGDVAGISNNVTLPVHDNMTITANFKPVCELLNNRNFINGAGNWTLYTSDGAIASLSTADRTGNIMITNGGSNIWSTQLSQTGIPMETGRSYTLSFDAFAETPRIIRSGAGKNSEPFNTYSYNLTSLTTVKKSFSYSFTMTEETDLAGKVLFDVGGNEGDVYISNISFCDGSKIASVKTENLTAEANDMYYTAGKIYFHFASTGQFSSEIYTLNGTCLRQTSHYISSNSEWVVGNLMPGLYFVKSIEKSGKTIINRLVIN